MFSVLRTIRPSICFRFHHPLIIPTRHRSKPVSRIWIPARFRSHAPASNRSAYDHECSGAGYANAQCDIGRTIPTACCPCHSRLQRPSPSTTPPRSTTALTPSKTSTFLVRQFQRFVFILPVLPFDCSHLLPATPPLPPSQA